MTEQEWLACTDPREMLEALRASGKASDRKLRLFACACCRLVWGSLIDQRSRGAVEVAERFADGLAGPGEMDAARPAAEAAFAGAEAFYQETVTTYGHYDREDECEAAEVAIASVARPVWPAVHALRGWVSFLRERKPRLLRDIFGPIPFRLVSTSPGWQTPQVVALAQAAYDERELPAGTLDTTWLAVLADALEEAGCVQADILGHLRGPGPHVRGCWAVDLLLGKE